MQVDEIARRMHEEPLSFYVADQKPDLLNLPSSDDFSLDSLLSLTPQRGSPMSDLSVKSLSSDFARDDEAFSPVPRHISDVNVLIDRADDQLDLNFDADGLLHEDSHEDTQRGQLSSTPIIPNTLWHSRPSTDASTNQQREFHWKPNNMYSSFQRDSLNAADPFQIPHGLTGNKQLDMPLDALDDAEPAQKRIRRSKASKDKVAELSQQAVSRSQRSYVSRQAEARLHRDLYVRATHDLSDRLSQLFSIDDQDISSALRRTFDDIISDKFHRINTPDAQIPEIEAARIQEIDVPQPFDWDEDVLLLLNPNLLCSFKVSLTRGNSFSIAQPFLETGTNKKLA